MLRRMVLGLALMVSLGSVTGAHAFNPQPDPPAFAALREAIAALPSTQNPQPLIAKTDAAAASIDRGNLCAASGQLDALSNFVSVKTGDTIPERNAVVLQSAIQAIRDVNGVSPGPC